MVAHRLVYCYYHRSLSARCCVVLYCRPTLATICFLHVSRLNLWFALFRTSVYVSGGSWVLAMEPVHTHQLICILLMSYYYVIIKKTLVRRRLSSLVFTASFKRARASRHAALYRARSLIATTSSVASFWRRRGRRGGKGKIRVLH